MSYNAEERLEILLHQCESRPHGTMARYNAGCSCEPCRRCARDYKRQRKVARLCGDRRELVKADRAREHLAALKAAGFKRAYIAACAGVSEATLSFVANGEKTKLRAHTERKILSVRV